MTIGVLKAIVVGHQNGLQFQSKGQHVNVNVREPGQIARRAGTAFSLLNGRRGDISPLDVGGFNQHHASWTQPFEF
jgi:hypothetical protein